MSLLMEALRKAEEAKRKQHQDPPAVTSPSAGTTSSKAPAAATTPTELTLAPLDDKSADAAELDEAEFAGRGTGFRDADSGPTDDPYPEPLLTEPEPPGRGGARNLARRPARAAAASVFTAKQNPARASQKTLTVLVIAMVVVLAGGGGTLWYLQSAVPSSLGVNPAIANYNVAAREQLSQAPVAPATTAPALVGTPEAAAPAAEEEAAETVAANPAGNELAAEASNPTTVPQLIPPAFAPPGVDTVLTTETTEELTPRVLEISRSTGSRAVNPSLVTAYERLQSGNLAGAGELYEGVLGVLPNNRDALLGLAQVRARQGNSVAARELYARVLQLNPRDALAQTGLLQSLPAVDTAAHENALKALIGQYPGVAPLELALGNLYAAQQRWSEAQGAYYNALLSATRAADMAVHPDYAFNLAVSLEQLGQSRAALQYYRQARMLAEAVTPGFDRALLDSRLAYLEQNQ